MGVVSCTIAFVLLGRVQTQGALYGAAALLAVTSATVVTGLNSLSSFEASADERGNKLGNHRSFGKTFTIVCMYSILTPHRTSRPRPRTFDLLLTILVGRPRNRIRDRCRGHGRCMRARFWWIEGTARYREHRQEAQKDRFMSYVSL